MPKRIDNRIGAGLALALGGAISATSFMGTFARASSYLTFDLQDCPYTNAVAIKVKGNVAGECEGDFGSYGFVRTADGMVQTFDIEGNETTWVNSLNRKDETVGFYYSDEDGYTHSFVRKAGGHVQHIKIRNAADVFALAWRRLPSNGVAG